MSAQQNTVRSFGRLCVPIKGNGLDHGREAEEGRAWSVYLGLMWNGSTKHALRALGVTLSCKTNACLPALAMVKRPPSGALARCSLLFFGGRNSL
jgi:predicted heme/steroid binding protein